MELDLIIQAQALLLALATGLLLGLFYDVLRPLRQLMRRLSCLFDTVYAVCAGFAVFSLAMSLPHGRIGLWESATAGAAFWLYLRLLSPRILPLISRLFGALFSELKKILENLRKV